MMTTDCQTEASGAFRQVLHVTKHTQFADVVAALGGGDTAPGPHEYFDMSLAACKALTAHWYAKHHGIALDRVEVHVERDDARERAKENPVYRLSVRLAYFGALSDADRDRLHDAVSRCPIHKLMTTTTIEIETAPRT